MRRVFFSLLTVAAIVLFGSAVSTTEQGAGLKAGEDPGVPNKTLYRPVVKPAFDPGVWDPQALSVLATEELMKVQQGTFDTSVKYRGVLACDVDNDGRDEVIVDFGSLGVYLYDSYRSPNWTQLDTRNPEIMIAVDHDGDGDYLIVVSWGSGNGADYWVDGQGWTGFNNTGWHDQHYFSADVDGDGDEEVVVKTINISSGDPYVYMVGADGNWTLPWKALVNNITNSYGFACQFAAPDDELVYGFNGLQWWNHAAADPDYTDNWTSMTGGSPDMWDSLSANVDGDTEQEFCADVLNGLWIYDYSNATKWVRINNRLVLDMRATPTSIGTDEELLVSFSGLAGLWMYWRLGSPKWQRLNALTPDTDQGFCEVFNPDGDTDMDVAVDFGGATGIWKYDWFGVPKWTPFNGNDAIYMVKADINGDGEDELLVKFVSPVGLWKWDDDTTPNWIRINGAIPD